VVSMGEPAKVEEKAAEPEAETKTEEVKTE
jgi:hypothetical protein